MANQTVSTNLNIDSPSISGLVNGDDITIQSGAILTINSDNRWSQQAAVIGNITLDTATGGQLYIDGTTVWWVPYDGGTGNVPSLGTVGVQDVTRSSSPVAEFLGIFTGLGVVPNTAGSAMPSVGFAKFRSKSVNFSDNDVLTFANGATITVNSSTGGQRGWLHVVGEEFSTINVTRSGILNITGDWFHLTTSNGLSGQSWQHYAYDWIPAIWVETSSGSNVYEKWKNVGQKYIPTRISKDERSKVFTCNPYGLITINGDTHGSIPALGCKILVPNIHISSAPTSNYSLNVLSTTLSTRWDITSSSAGIIKISNLIANNYLSLSQSYSVFIKDSAITNRLNVNEVYNGLTIDNVAVAPVSGDSLSSNIGLYLPYAKNAIISNSDFYCYGGTNAAVTSFDFTSCENVSASNCIFSVLDRIGNSQVISLSYIGSKDCQISDCTFIDTYVNFSGAINGKMINNKMEVRMIGNSVTANTLSLYDVSNSLNCTIIGVGTMRASGGLYRNNLFVPSNTTNLTVKNIGSRTNPFSFQDQLNLLTTVGTAKSSNIKISNVYLTNCRDSDNFILGSNSEDAYIIKNSGEISGGSNFQYDILNSTYKRLYVGSQLTFGTGTSQILTTYTGTYGSHFYEVVGHMLNPTEIGLGILFCPKSLSTLSQSAYSVSGSPLFDVAGGLRLININDQVTYTWPYFILGCNSFQNLSPILSGTNTGNVLIEYDIDKGDGFTGLFKTCNGANLSSETINPDPGFKLKIRFTCIVASNLNILNGFLIKTNTDATSIDNYPYPVNDIKITFDNNQPGSAIATFRNSDNRRLLYNGNITGSYYDFIGHNDIDYDITLRKRTPGYIPQETSLTLTNSDISYSTIQTKIANISGTDLGNLNIGITVNNPPITSDGYQYSISVNVSGNYTLDEVANYLNYNISKIDYFNGYRGIHWPGMIEPDSNYYKTVGGKLYGSSGNEFKGVIVFDSNNNKFSGFSKFQSDSGDYWIAPNIAHLIVSPIVPYSRLQVYNISTSGEIVNEIISGGTYDLQYTNGSIISNGDSIRIRTTFISGAYALEEKESFGIASSTGLTVSMIQNPDTYYNINAIDGSTVTEYIADFPNIQIDINDLDSSSTVQRLYAFYKNELYSSGGINNFFGAITAFSAVKYRINVDLVNLTLNNINPLIRFKLIGGYLYRSDNSDIVAPTSYTFIHTPSEVYAVETGTSGLTNDEALTLNKIKNNTGLIPALL